MAVHVGVESRMAQKLRFDSLDMHGYDRYASAGRGTQDQREFRGKEWSKSMTHILIGCYRSLSEAEAIVQECVEQGFARPHITLVTPHATIPASEDHDIQTWSTLEGAQALQRRFLDLGIPDSEVYTYTEAVRQGETLVVVHASAEQAERGLEILHEPRPDDRQAKPPQWQYLGHVGVVSYGDATRHTSPGTVDTPGLTHAEAAFRQHQEATASESGLTYLEYEPAYRYGYDVGQRIPAQEWGTLEAALREGWERWHPGTWERFKEAVQYGWETVHGSLDARSP
jgi:hypothetical protein